MASGDLSSWAMALAMRPTSANRWASAARRSSARASVRSAKNTAVAPSVEQRGAVAQRLLPAAPVHRDLAAGDGHSGAPGLAQHPGERGHRRVAARELLEVAAEHRVAVYTEDARGRGVEHADTTVAVGGDGRGLNVLQHCARELIDARTSDTHGSPLEMQYVPRKRVTNVVGRGHRVREGTLRSARRLLRPRRSRGTGRRARGRARRRRTAACWRRRRPARGTGSRPGRACGSGR